MKDTLGLIPQVFYDLIGRVAPGAAALSLGVLLLTEETRLHSLLSLNPLSAAVVGACLIAGFVASYIVGFVLGALGSITDADRFLRAAFDAMKDRAGVEFEELSRVYDFIIKNDPAAGARLAKLRAETHLCGAIVVGSLALATAYAIRAHRFDRDGLLVLAALGLSLIAALIFQRHLRSRTLRLQINYWVLLEGTKPAAKKPAGEPVLPIKQPAEEPRVQKDVS